MQKKQSGAKKALGRLTAILMSMILLAVAVAPTAAAASSTKSATKYPIVLVHGAGFGDKTLGVIDYWGRIPAALKDNGAKVYYGGTDGWGSIESNAAALKKTVENVLAETGAKKVNIIAHSKGGVEARYMISSLGMASSVASLSMIATPNHGSTAMENILGKFPDFVYRGISAAANAVRFVWGDKNPDFYNGIQSLSVAYMKEFNKQNKDQKGVYYQSYAAALHAPASDLILCWPAYVIRDLEGENDGMVSVSSAKWTNFRGVLRGTGYRGVSHLDEVDVRRIDVSIDPALNGGTTVREFYINLAAELKQMGY